MKNAINHYMNALIFAGLTSLASTDLAAQAVQNNQSPKPPSTAKPVKGAQDESRSAALDAARVARLLAEEERSLKWENKLLELVQDTHVTANFARAGYTSPSKCKWIGVAAANDYPRLIKEVYAESLEARKNLGGIEEDVKSRRLEGFNMLADFFKSNVNLIRAACIATDKIKPTTLTRKLAP